MSAMGVVGVGKALPGGVGLDQVGLGGVGVGFGGASLGMGVPGVGMGTGGAMVSETPARIAGGGECFCQCSNSPWTRLNLPIDCHP